NAHSIHFRASCWSSLRTANSTGLTTCDEEAIEVRARRLKTRQLNMHAMAKLRACHMHPALNDSAEVFIFCHFPADLDRTSWHTAELGKRIRCKPCPDDEAVRPRIPRCDAKRERIGIQLG